MRKIIFILFSTFILHLNIWGQQSIYGEWSGDLISKMGKVQITLQLSSGPLSGKLSSSLGLQGVSLYKLSFTNNLLKFSIPSFNVEYEGTLINEEIRGIWDQAGLQVPLNFFRVITDDQTGFIRPQTPVEPYPYRVENVTIEQKDGPNLSGTLTIPNEEGPFPAVILLSVAGANDRDQSHSNGHKPFLVLADHLTKNGIAVLRYDDRGIGGSEGDLFQSDFNDLTQDALAAFRLLTNKKEVDAKKIGFIGNSEGTIIGAMASIKEPKVAFNIMLGAVGVPLSDLEPDRLERMQPMYQLSEIEKAEIIRYSSELGQIISKNIPSEDKKTMITALKAENTFDKAGFKNHLFFLPSNKEDRITLFLTPWYKAQITYNPEKILTHVSCPTLVINGSLDVFQSPELNFPAIQNALFKAGNNDFTLVIAPNINHVMQTASTGFPTEYAEISGTFAPIILNTITYWIKARF